MTNQLHSEAEASERPTQSWTDASDSLLQFVQGADVDDESMDDVVGAQTVKTEDIVTFPLAFRYCRNSRRTSYRSGAAILGVNGLAGAQWMEIDPQTTLRTAFERYGLENLLAYEKVVRRATIEMLALPLLTRHEQSLRVLIRKPLRT